MKGNKTIRIILGIVLLILLGIYLYLTGSARTNGKKFQELAARQVYRGPGGDGSARGNAGSHRSAGRDTGTISGAGREFPAGHRYNELGVPARKSPHDIGEYAPPVDYIEGIGLDSRIIEPMREFIAAARAEGLSVYPLFRIQNLCGSELSVQPQDRSGYSPEDAAKIVAKPGTSEHQTGLACDITDVYRDPKTIEECENTATYQWMSQHCQEYGFIVRFPDGKSDITGIMYEPWHFRYVGVEAATYIMENGLCFEEFLDLYQQTPAEG